MMNKDDVKEILIKIVVEETQALLDSEENLNEATVLLGAEGILDSMGLVSLIVAVEQDVEDEFGKEITIADAKSMSQKNSPFRTVGSLVDYIDNLLNEEE